MAHSKNSKTKFAYPYTSFRGFVTALQKLDMTTSHWDELSDEEQEQVIEISAQLSNSMGELKRINPKRWDDASLS